MLAAAAWLHAPIAELGVTPYTDGRRELIKVAGTQAVDANTNDLDPDDFLWEKLPGRCCFYGTRKHPRFAPLYAEPRV